MYYVNVTSVFTEVLPSLQRAGLTSPQSDLISHPEALQSDTNML